MATDTEELSRIMKLNRNPEGYFIEAHVKLRPVDMAGDGVLLVRYRPRPQADLRDHFPGPRRGLAGSDLLSKSEIKLSAITAKVDTDHCVKCLTCVRCCPFEVPAFNESDRR